MEVNEARFFLRLLCALTVFIPLKRYSAALEFIYTLSLGASLTGNQTIISKNGTFELGFFSPNGTNNWYIGIWYAQLSEKAIVWVANRETPVRYMPGVLHLSREGDRLALFDGYGDSVWSVNVTKKASGAVILDSGNFLILGVGDDNKSEPVWQSFDHPVDTFLAGMRFGGPQKLVGWKNSLDPAPGLFSFQTDPSGAKQFVLRWNNSVQYWESGVWNGKIFAHLPEMSQTNKNFYNLSVDTSSSDLYVSYKMVPTMTAVSARFVVDKAGAIRLYILIDGDKWNTFASNPEDQCTVYNLCGACGTCSPNHLPFCRCVEGFKPRDNRAWDLQDWWTSGCVPQRPLNCDAKNGSTDGFNHLSVSLPENQYSSYPAQSKIDCEKTCVGNCSCTAFSYEQASGTCRIWFGDLVNMQDSSSESSSHVFIRVGNSALNVHLSSSWKGIKTAIVAVAAVAVVLGISIFLMWRRRQLPSTEIVADNSDALLIRSFMYKELKIATSNFKYKLGKGGFGSVFKGTLPDDTLVAVKKLEDSRQAEKQFRAEISSIGNIQHVNLVRLRGFCAEASRRLLVYDYMPNGSLNSFLFTRNPKSRQKLLDWNTRFEIALGTARGLVYLHEYCRDRIIHGDVKPENILLDGDFSPKLADFGLAKVVGRDFSRVLTTTRGTRGYLAPEWISGLPITPKVDVYSFGMTLFELISGRRNLELSVQDSSMYYFPAWAAMQIDKGNLMNIVDERIANDAVAEEVRRATLVSLLCTQNDENARPSMGQVVLMLEGKTEAHTPQIPNSALIQPDGDKSDSDTDNIV